VEPQFVSEPIVPASDHFEIATMALGEPSLPPAFSWRDELLTVSSVVRTWRSTKTDRGEDYLKRHWFEFDVVDGRRAVVYFDRGARRGAARWWLYTLTPAREVG
jgi:hypothetical protein